MQMASWARAVESNRERSQCYQHPGFSNIDQDGVSWEDGFKYIHILAPRFHEVFGHWHCCRWDTEIGQILGMTLGDNRETLQEACVCPKFYTGGCSVSTWMDATKSADSFSPVTNGISITFSVTVLHPIKTHRIENTVVEVTLCSW